MTEIPAKHPGESAFSWGMLLFSIFMFYQSYKIDGFSALSSSGAIPLAASAVMIISSCIVVIKNFSRPAAEGGMQAFFSQIVPGTVAIFCGLILIFAIVLDAVGFILTAFSFLLVSIWFLYKRGFIPALLLALLSIVMIYVLFRLIFQVVLPEGVVPEREIMATIKNFFSSGAEP